MEPRIVHTEGSIYEVAIDILQILPRDLFDHKASQEKAGVRVMPARPRHEYGIEVTDIVEDLLGSPESVGVNNVGEEERVYPGQHVRWIVPVIGKA